MEYLLRFGRGVTRRPTIKRAGDKRPAARDDGLEELREHETFDWHSVFGLTRRRDYALLFARAKTKERLLAAIGLFCLACSLSALQAGQHRPSNTVLMSFRCMHLVLPSVLLFGSLRSFSSCCSEDSSLPYEFVLSHPLPLFDGVSDVSGDFVHSYCN